MDFLQNIPPKKTCNAKMFSENILAKISVGMTATEVSNIIGCNPEKFTNSIQYGRITILFKYKKGDDILSQDFTFKSDGLLQEVPELVIYE